MPVLDISDQTLVPLGPAQVRSDPSGPCGLAAWVPGLALTPVLDRGAEGVLWRAAAGRPGPRGVESWHGTAEVWLEPWHSWTVVHLFVRLDPAPGSGGPGLPAGTSGDRTLRRWREALVERWKVRLLLWRHAREREQGHESSPVLKTDPAVADGGGRDIGPSGAS